MTTEAGGATSGVGVLRVAACRVMNDACGRMRHHIETRLRNQSCPQQHEKDGESHDSRESDSRSLAHVYRILDISLNRAGSTVAGQQRGGLTGGSWDKAKANHDLQDSVTMNRAAEVIATSAF